MTPVGIIGCGSTGLALAAHVTQQGGAVRTMVDQNHHLLDRLRRSGTLTMSGHLGDAVFALPELSDGYESLAECGLIFIATTADRHLAVAQSLASVLHEGQLCVLATGYANGASAFAKALTTTGFAGGEDCVVAMNTTPHLSYAPGDGSVHISAVKSWFEVSGASELAARKAMPLLTPWFPAATLARHQVASSLNNPNPVAHVPAAVLNAVIASQEAHGLIPHQGAFHLGDFGAPALEALRNVLDAERLAVMRALGIGRHGVRRNDFSSRAYGPNAREMLPPRVGPTFQRRFVTEDVPCGLVPLEVLGRRAGTPTPAMTAVISLICTLEGQDFREHPAVPGRVAGLGPNGMAGQRHRVGALK
jgi:hypothetical protein